MVKAPSVRPNDKDQAEEPALSESGGHVTGANLENLRRFLEERRRRTARLLERPDILVAVAETISNTYAIVCDNFDPAKTDEVHELLDKLKQLGAVVVDRRDVHASRGISRKVREG